MRRTLSLLILGALGACRTGDQLPPGADALVTRRQVTVAFPAEWPVREPTDSTRSDLRGSYNWKFRVAGPTGFIVILSLGHDTAPTSAQLRSLKAAMRGASLRMCELPGGVMADCRRGVDGNGHVMAGERVVMVVRDTALVRRLLRERPSYLWRSVQWPDTVMLLDSVPITYRDAADSSDPAA